MLLMLLNHTVWLNLFHCGSGWIVGAAAAGRLFEPPAWQAAAAVPVHVIQAQGWGCQPKVIK